MASPRPMAERLLTERLVLRPWRFDDAGPHRRLWAERDHRALRRLDADGRPTVDDLRRGTAEREAGLARLGLALHAVASVEDDRTFLGYCGLVVGQATAEEPELAYELLREHHGHGYATEAARAVVAEAAAAGRHRLWATVREWNAPSFRVLAKLGFADSGRRTPDEERGDSVWMTLDLTSWADAQERDATKH